MKIGILNLPFDNNYGGNLQRYALMVILKKMGHEAIHLNCRYQNRNIKTLLTSYFRKLAQIFFLFLDETGICHKLNSRYGNRNIEAERFYRKYINHTHEIHSYEELKKYIYFDCYIVGSDQVWRKAYNFKELGQYFFDFLPNDKRRIGYSVSFGVDYDEYTQDEILKYESLYKKFNAVSVREKDGIKILSNRGWLIPQAKLTVDPTLLLHVDDYIRIIKENSTEKPSGNLLLYVLDNKAKMNEVIAENQLNTRYTAFSMTIDTRRPVSIPQWLRNIAEAECVITDSYHGLLFSIIFNKPFYVVINNNRGASRFYSILELLSLDKNSLGINDSEWSAVNLKLEELKKDSTLFLKQSLM